MNKYNGFPDAFFMFNKGRVWANGELYEEGAWYQNPVTNESEYMSAHTDGSIGTEYVREDKPFCNWKALRNGEEEHYDISKTAAKKINGFMANSDFEEFDKCNAIDYWLAKSHIGSKYELYFNVIGTDMLMSVCSHYGLKYPVSHDYDLEDREAIRFKSYELDGEVVEIILGSVVFINNKPKMVKLYEVTRGF